MTHLTIVKSLGGLPEIKDPNTIYFNLVNNSVEVYVTDNNGINIYSVTSNKTFDNLQYKKSTSPNSEISINITDFDINKTYEISCLYGDVERLVDPIIGKLGDVIIYYAPDKECDDIITVNGVDSPIKVQLGHVDKPIILSPSSPYNSPSNFIGSDPMITLSNYVNSDPSDLINRIEVKVIDPIFNPYYNEDWKSFVIQDYDINYDYYTGNILVYIRNLYFNDGNRSIFDVSVRYISNNGIASEYSDVLTIIYQEQLPTIDFIPSLDTSYPIVAYGNLGFYPGAMSLRINQDYIATRPELGSLIYYYLQVAEDFDFNNIVINTDSLPIDLSNNVIDISNILNYSKTYYARVYCKFSNIDALTVWSEVQTFVTSSVPNLENPLVMSFGSVPGTNRIKATVNSFTSYHNVNLEYVHWQVSRNAQFTDLVYDQDGINGSYPTYESFYLNLNYSTGYFIRARWKDSLGRYSNWTGFEYVVTDVAPVVSIEMNNISVFPVVADGEEVKLYINVSSTSGVPKGFINIKEQYRDNNISEFNRGNFPIDEFGNVYYTRVVNMASETRQDIYLQRRFVATFIGTNEFSTIQGSNSLRVDYKPLLTVSLNGYGWDPVDFTATPGSKLYFGVSMSPSLSPPTQAKLYKNGMQVDPWKANSKTMSSFSDGYTDLTYDNIEPGINEFTVVLINGTNGIDSNAVESVTTESQTFRVNTGTAQSYRYDMSATNGMFIGSFYSFSEAETFYRNYWNAGQDVGTLTWNPSGATEPDGSVYYNVTSTIYGTRVNIMKVVPL